MKKQTSLLLLAFVVGTFARFSYAEENEENFDPAAFMAAAMAAANQPVVPNNKPIVIGQMDPNAIYEPGLVVYDPASKHIVIVNSSGQAQEFKGIIKNGEVVQYTNTGTLYMRCPINAKKKLHGTAKRFDKKGFMFHVSEYKDGLLDGKLTSYYPDGKLATETTYSKDVMHGPAKTYYPNGQLMSQANYINGLPDSSSVQYTENGKKVDAEEGLEMRLGEVMNATQPFFSPEYLKEAQAEIDAWDGNKIIKADR